MGITNLDYDGLPKGRVRECSGWPNVVKATEKEQPATPKKGPGRPPKKPEPDLESDPNAGVTDGNV